MADDFKDFPKSIQELKAERSGLAEDETARSTLIALLRDIDNGEVNPDHLVVAYTELDSKGARLTAFRAAGKDFLIHIGLLTKIQMRIIDGAREV